MLLSKVVMEVEESREFLKVESKAGLLNEVHCYIVVILSHNLSKRVAGVDDQKVPVQDLMDLFDGIQCPALIGIPKMLLSKVAMEMSEEFLFKIT